MRVRNVLTSLVCLGWVVAPAGAADAESARYRVNFERIWSGETHPSDFPLLAHFSPVIGVTHADGYQPFRKGAVASAGVEKLCEDGKHQPLDAEIKAAIVQGMAGALIESSDAIRSVPGSASAEFVVDSQHPMVSIAAMIAPSPDWCAVAAGVPLMEGGRFVSERSVDLHAWDAGTDSARSYRARDADMQPRGQVQPSDAPYFSGDASRVGRVTFTRLP